MFLFKSYKYIAILSYLRQWEFLLITIIIFTSCDKPESPIDNSEISYNIATWKDFKTASVSFTFDDGVITQFTKAIPILDKYNLKGSFFIVINQLPITWGTIKSYIENGHEFGSHTLTHPYLTHLTSYNFMPQIKRSQEIIDEELNPYKCITFCYPHGNKNAKIEKITSEYYIAGRGTDTYSFNTSPPNDYFNYYVKKCESGISLSEMNSYIDHVIEEGKYLIEMYHGFDSYGFSPISSRLFESHIKYLKSHESKLWIATFSDVVKYTKEKENARVKLTKIDDLEYSFSVNDYLPKDIYNIPLTIRLTTKNRYEGFKVLQSDSTVIKESDLVFSSITLNIVPKGDIYTIRFKTKLE
jgi:peptidoglycan-N-acetylglucosamine deacetylase